MRGARDAVSLDADLASLSATRIALLVGAGEVSPVEVVEAALGRIERRNGALNAVVTLNERALDDARALEKSLARATEPGLLCGVPVGIKDVTPVAGLRTTYGSPLFADHVPQDDALVVRRLRAAGAIILGKTNTPEFATGANTFNEVFGRTRNPWDVSRSAGGSTGGGAAALASGMIALAEGTDLGGSLRIPASFCGVVGLRLSPGLVPTWPTDWAWDDLAVSGPMARTAEDVALMLQAVAGPTPFSPHSQSVWGRDFARAVHDGPRTPLRLAYCADLAALGVDPEIEGVCRSAALGLVDTGASVEGLALELPEARDTFLHLRGLWMVIHHYERLDRLDALGANLRGNIDAGLRLSTRDIAWAERARGRICDAFKRSLETFDLLLTPTVAVPPFDAELNYPEKVGGMAMKTYVDWFAPTFVLSLTGLPVASVPCGLDGEGLPVGLQVVGPPRGEEAVLALAHAIQRRHPIGSPPLE